MEILILLGLMILNGVFAMSEMAIVTSKKVILQEKSKKGNKSAGIALQLAEDPDRFLSTVQVGITLIGILAGAFGGSTIANDIAGFIRTELPFLAPQADQLGFGMIIILTTYLSLVIGELVPKRIALNYSERVAVLMAPMMFMLSRIATPIVWFLSKSTELVTRVLRIKDTEASVTDMEIIAMVREGVNTGAFDPEEHLMIRGVLELDDIQIREIMTPRIDMISLNLQDDAQELLAKIAQEALAVYPVWDGDIDNIIGIIHSEDILKQLLENKVVDLKSLLREAIFIPETAIVANVLKLFREPATKVILVIDEYGGVEGLVSENDIIAEILGYLDTGASGPVEREDGSWLFDGSFAIDDIQHFIPEFGNPRVEGANANSLAGFILTKLGRITKTGDKMIWKSFSIEVIDMDGRRIDKVLISQLPAPSATDIETED
ncbi:hemolysin family protein [Anaerolineales bacterium]